MEITEGELARLLLKARYVTPLQLKECREQVAEKRAGGVKDRRPAADLTLELIGKQYCTSEQLKEIIDAHNAKRGRLFGEIALKLHLLTQDDLDGALAQQKELRERGQKTRIGAILVGRDLMKPHQVESILKEQGKRVARCEHCKAMFNVRLSASASKFKCKKCGKISALTSAGDADAMTVDDTLVGVSAVAPIASPDSGGVPSVTVGELFGDYEAKQKLGDDHLGSTYKARRNADGAPIALKVLDRRHSGDKAFVEQLQRRVAQVAQLKHPNLRRVFAMGSGTNGTYVALQFVRGESLYGLLASERAPSPRKALAIAVQLCDAISHIHSKGIVHGDIRPSTVMITPKGTVLLTNLGLSIRPADNIRRIAASAGIAPFYVAPEQIGGKREVDFRADIYGLGATLYHLLAGRPPFEGQDPNELLLRFSDDSFPPPSRYNPEVPEAVSHIVVRCLAADPDERYQSISELREHLAHPERVADAQSTKMVRMLKDDADLRPLGRAARSLGGRSGMLGIAAATVVVLLVVATAVMGHLEDKQAREAASKRFEELYTDYASGRDQLLLQQRIERELKTFLASNPPIPQARRDDLSKYIKDVARRHRQARADKSAELRKAVLEKCATGDYDHAEDLRVRSLRIFAQYDDVVAELEGLRSAIQREQQKGYDATLASARALVEQGKLTEAIKTLRQVVSPPFDASHKTQAEAEIARIEQALAAADQAAAARERAESKARADKAIADSAGPERQHQFRLAIKQLEQAKKTVLAEHRPLLDPPIAALQRQLEVLTHLERVDLADTNLTVTVDGRVYRVESISAAFLVLTRQDPGGKGERRDDINWSRLTSADVLRLAADTLARSKRPKELRLGMVLFALRHDLPEQALQLVSVDRLDGEPDARTYRAEARERVSKIIATTLGQAAEQKDARARLLACLAAEQRYRPLLALLPEQAKTLRAAVVSHLAELGGAGTTIDFDGALDGAFAGSAPTLQTRLGDRFARLSGAGLRTKASGKLPACLVFAPHAGKTQLTVQHGKMALTLKIADDGTLGGWLTGGTDEASAQVAPQKLAGPRDRWRVLELRLTAGKLTVLLDGVTLVATPAAAESAPLDIRTGRGAAPVDIDLIHVAK